MIEKKHWNVLTLTLAACLTCGVTDVALAKKGHGGGDAAKVNEKIAVEIVDTTGVAPRHARLRVRRKNDARTELRLQLADAQPGFALDIWFDDGTGAMELIAPLRTSRDGGPLVSYDWRVRTQKGQALPFGVSDVAALSGRAFEVRDGSVLVARGTMPGVAAVEAPAGKRAEARSALATGDDTLAAGDDAIETKIRVRRKNGREDLEIEVEHAAAGLVLEAWIEDADGALRFVGGLDEQTAGTGAEYELEIESERDALPFGVASLSELAGRAVEIRTAGGDVLASGFVPALGAPDAAARDSSGPGSGDDASDTDEDDHTGGDDAADTDEDDHTGGDDAADTDEDDHTAGDDAADTDEDDHTGGDDAADTDEDDPAAGDDAADTDED